MDAASEGETLDEILNNPANFSIINSCGWPITKVISLSTKTEFIHRLVYHEVIGKRLPAIFAFKKGLSILNIADLL